MDIDTAVGAQLDLIGQILGIKRNIYGLTFDTDFFSFEKEDAFGFSDKNALSQGYWKSYKNSTGSSYALSDGDYRAILKFKAAYNLRRGSWGEFEALLYEFFGDEITMTNNKDLSVTFTVANGYSLALRVAIFMGYIAPPVGIAYTIVYL